MKVRNKTPEKASVSIDDWLQHELMEIAEGDDIYDASKIEVLQKEAKSRGLNMHRNALRKRVNELRTAAQLAENSEQNTSAYQTFIDRMNTEHFVYTGADTVYIASWTYQNGRRVLVQRKAADFRLLVANEPEVFSPAIGRRLPAAEAWLRAPERREVTGFTFEPDLDKSDALAEQKLENLFEGFSVKPQTGSVDLFTTHLKEVIVANEPAERREALVDYLMNCFAHLVQKPGVPLKVAMVFRGREGAGKSFITDVIGSLFKGNVFETSMADDLVGRFTEHLLNACLVVSDEALFAGSKKDADVVKRLITQDTLRIEGKHKAILNEKNRMTLMFTSNHEHAVNVGLGDRRFVVFDVSDVKTPRAEHEQYWATLWCWAKSEAGKAALLDELLARDISGFDAQRDRPQTRARLDQMIASLDKVYRWFLEAVVEAPALPPEIQNAAVKMDALSPEAQHSLEANQRVYRKSGIYAAYADWEKTKMNTKYPTNERLFWKSMKDILGDGLITKKRIDGKGTPLVILPSRKERAELFLKAIGSADLGIDVLDLPAEPGEGPDEAENPNLTRIISNGRIRRKK